MKKLFAALIVLAMLIVTVCALAEASYYEQRLSNEASFGTLTEVRNVAPASLEAAYPGRRYIADPALDGIPTDTIYVYRSANYFSNNLAAYRMNTNLIVYTNETFADNDSALKYITDLGLVDIADQATGSVVLVTPADGTALGTNDQYNFFVLQSVMCNLGGSVKDAEGNTTYYADNCYYGGLTYRYLFGIGTAADFVNDMLMSVPEYVSRTAGVLTYGGNMRDMYDVAMKVPAYIINGSDKSIEKYKAANATTAVRAQDGIACYYNQEDPVCAVAVASADDLTADVVKNAYYSFLNRALRAPAERTGYRSGANTLRNYAFNQDPYILAARSPIVNGVTPEGICVAEYKSDIFADNAEENGNYLDTWYEFLPEEVLNNTAPEHSVPLWLGNHGGGDDPVQYVDEIGLLNLAAKERFAIVCPEQQSINSTRGKVLPLLVKYMLEKYPALDPSRVYTTGYSMGGGATLSAICGDPGLFAAAVPMAAVAHRGTEEEAARFLDYDLPMLFCTSRYDYFYDSTTFEMRVTAMCDYPNQLNEYLGYNEMDSLTYDFDQYPLAGFKADVYTESKLGDKTNYQWLLLKDGVPMMGLNVTEDFTHSLNPNYALVAWEFAKNYSRDPETGAVVYNPYVD